MKKVIFLLFLGVLASAFAQGRVRETFFTGAPVEVKVAVSEITEVAFPEKIAAITKGAPSEQLQIEVKGGKLYFLPLKAESASVYITTVDGVSFPLNLVISQNDWDVSLAVRTNKMGEKEKRINRTLDLMGKLILGIEPAGATKIQAGVEVFNNGELSLEADTVYELAKARGLILTAENLLERSIVFDIQRFQYPGLLAIYADRSVLAAKGEAGSEIKVYMVIKK